MNAFRHPSLKLAAIGAGMIAAALGLAAVTFGQSAPTSGFNGYYNQSFPFASNNPGPDDNLPTLMAKLIFAQTSPQMAAGRQVGAAYATAGQLVATADGAASLAGHAKRRRSAWVNLSTSETVWFGFAPGVNATTGVPVPPGGSAGVGAVSAVYFFSASGAARVAWFEAHD